MINGFKITRTDGTTHGGYRWPLPMPGERVRVEAASPTEHDNPCPQHEGDGLCVALTAGGACSGRIGLASCIGLLLEVDDADVLARSADKLRVRAVTVTGIFDVLAIIRSGFATDLSGANLRHASLSGANLRYADLRHADLRNASLSDADLRNTSLRHASLSGANLRYADLRHADLRNASLSDADLRNAELGHADLRGAVGRVDWDVLVERGATR